MQLTCLRKRCSPVSGGEEVGGEVGHQPTQLTKCTIYKSAGGVVMVYIHSTLLLLFTGNIRCTLGGMQWDSSVHFVSRQFPKIIFCYALVMAKVYMNKVYMNYTYAMKYKGSFLPGM